MGLTYTFMLRQCPLLHIGTPEIFVSEVWRLSIYIPDISDHCFKLINHIQNGTNVARVISNETDDIV